MHGLETIREMHALREARVIMPILGTDEAREQHTRFARNLATTFGGYTRWSVHGGWMHEGKIVEDNAYAYDVAVMTDLGTEALMSMATECAKALDQKALYIRHRDGVVEIIDLT